MFEKFGEFDSVEELNAAAERLKAQGDREALMLLTEENGIDREDAQDYLDGMARELANPLMAAYGKLKVEAKELKLEAVLMDWVNELQAECTNLLGLAEAIRKKGKGLDGYIAALADAGFKDKTAVDKRIVEKCGSDIKRIVGNHEFYIGIPDKKTRKALMREYYLGEKVEK